MAFIRPNRNRLLFIFDFHYLNKVNWPSRIFHWSSCRVMKMVNRKPLTLKVINLFKNSKKKVTFEPETLSPKAFTTSSID